MSHTTNAPGGTAFIHNGDYSGDVEIVAADKTRGVTIPFEDLMWVVADYVRLQRISKIEEASALSLLGLEKP